MKYFEKEIDEVFSKIEEADSIVIFGHVNPDGDCVGSVLGLRNALRVLFPNKKIYGVGSHPSFVNFVETSDNVDDETIKNSLCVMVDLSGMNRVEDKRILLTDNLVCIDHHEKSDEFNHPIVRDTNAPSATYVIAKCLMERYRKIPKEASTLLFLGLVTDSGRFQFYSDKDTFEVASMLVEAGADYSYVYNHLYVQSAKDLRFKSFVYSNFQFSGMVSYFIVHKSDYLPLGLNEQEAGCMVNLVSLLEGKPIWAEFCELENGKIRVELRSNGHYNVQKVAVKFGGGGHIPASGCQLDSLTMVPEVLKALNEAEEC
jgi:bifunctional oligoribonuclease and PAP phosphatase NrnA